MFGSQQNLMTKFFWTVGAITEATASMEMVLMNAFRLISGLSLEESKAIFYAPAANPVRQKIVTDLAKAKACDREIMDLLEEMKEAVNAALRKRNELAHSFLKSSTERVNFSQKSAYKGLSEEYLRNHMFTPVNDSYNRVYEAYDRLCTKLAACRT